MEEIGNVPYEQKLTMVVAEGMFLVGVMNETRMFKPRVLQIIDNGKRIQLSTLPGNPPYITIGNSVDIAYEIPGDDHVIYDLYSRVTNPKPNQENIISIDSKLN